MKKIKTGVLVLTVLIMVMLLSVSIFFAVSPKVYDKAELFSKTELDALEKNAVELAAKLKLDIVIVTINDSEGKTSREYADDFYDENGFGNGADKDGVLMLINMGDREVYISTCGAAIKYFTDARIESILDKVYPYLSDQKYSDSGLAFLKQIEYYVGEGIPEDQYVRVEDNKTAAGQEGILESSDISSEPKGSVENNNTMPVKDSSVNTTVVAEKIDFKVIVYIYLFLSTGIAWAAVEIMARNNKGKTVVNKNSYLVNKSIDIIDSEDIHVDTRITQVTIRSKPANPPNRRSTTRSTSSSSSSSSTTHSSSGGISHGGGGRKF